MSKSCDWRSGLARYGGEQASASPASRRPSELNSTSGSAGAARADRAGQRRARPSPACACRGSRGRTPRLADPAQRLARRLGVARPACPTGRSAVAQQRRLVALSSTTSRRLPASGLADVAARSRAASVRRRRAGTREREGRALRRAVALGPHRCRPSARQPLADREPEAGAAVLARRRRVGLRERLEQRGRHAVRARRGRCRCRARRTSTHSTPLAARPRCDREHAPRRAR